MKSVLVAAILSAVCVQAHSQSQCTSGIYQRVGLTPGFFSVHVNGSTAIAISLDFTANNGATSFSYAGLGTARPSQLQMWDYMYATFNGQSYAASGTEFKGACYANYSIVCDGQGGATATILSISQTPAGASWAFNCNAALTAAIQSGQHIVPLRKAF